MNPSARQSRKPIGLSHFLLCAGLAKLLIAALSDLKGDSLRFSERQRYRRLLDRLTDAVSVARSLLFESQAMRP